jgi:hypothetical protein
MDNPKECCHFFFGMCIGERSGSQKIGSAAGHTGPHDPENAHGMEPLHESFRQTLSASSFCGLDFFCELVVNDFYFQRQLCIHRGLQISLEKQIPFCFQIGAFSLLFNTELCHAGNPLR